MGSWNTRPMNLARLCSGSLVTFVPSMVTLPSSNYLKLLSALIVAVFLTVPYWKGKYFSKPVKKGGVTHA